MLIRIHPDDPQPRLIKQAVECLQAGGVIIYPTDTIYGIGCDISNADAVTRICRIKGIDPKKSHFSFVCNGLEHLGNYTKALDKAVFRLLKASLPGPYTFILEASKQVPRMLKTKRDTVGIRVPDNKICQLLVRELGRPIISSSLPTDGDVAYYTDPELIEEQFGQRMDMVIDGGAGGLVPSTVIDCSSGVPELIREGAGQFEH